MSYTIEQLCDHSHQSIQDLYKKAFNNYTPLDIISDKYNTNVFGLKNVGFFAVSDTGEKVAYYGVFPIILQYDNVKILVAQSGDTMTSPQHQKKGLFVKLALETYTLCKLSGIKMIFGFPNENSYPGFVNKLNWVFSGNMQKFTLNVVTIPFCELVSKFPSLKHAYDKFVNLRISKYIVEPTEEVLSLINFCEVNGQILKDINFINYKLSNKNVKLLKYNEFYLLVKTIPHLSIGAVGKFDQSKTETFINSIIELSKKIGCKKAIFTLSKNHWLFNYLSDFINPEQGLPIGYYIIDNNISYQDIQFTLADCDTF